MRPYSSPKSGRNRYRGMLLDFNERTTRPDRSIFRALLSVRSVNRYPEYGPVEQAVASYAGVSKDMVLLTNGSDEAIDLIMRVSAGENDRIIIPTPSFSMFFQSAAIIGAAIVSPSYLENGACRFPLREILATITKTTKLVVLCNPNNPTGTGISLSDIETILKNASSTLVMVDEAYQEFSGISAVPLLSRYPNLIITRTFSKAFGLAGLRIGYVLASPTIIKMLSAIKSPYSVNALAAAAANAALRRTNDMRSYAAEVMDRSKPLLEAFFLENGVPFFASRANFLLIAPTNPESVAKKLEQNGILVRTIKKPEIGCMLRISIGTIRETKRFIRIYRSAILPSVRIALIDRDGTLIYEPQDTFQVNSVDQLRILPGVVKTLRSLMRSRYRLVMITNQDGLGTNANPEEAFALVQKALLARLKRYGIVFNRILVCPHLPNDGCPCRKPKTGLLRQLGRDRRNISLMIGDRESDKELATRVRVPFIRMTTNGDMSAAVANADAYSKNV